MKILRVPIKKEWYNKILNEDKREEYREIKFYWTDKLEVNDFSSSKLKFVKYDAIEFVNGYAENSPRFLIEHKGTKIGYGKLKWGGLKNVLVYVIKLGNLIEK
jgi:hypothetical protein